MSKDNFIDRWSKRKIAVEKEIADEAEAAEIAVEEAEAVIGDDAQVELREEDANLVETENGDELDGEGEGEEQEPHPAEGIDIETLEYDSDFTVFMNDKVPEALRRMALRKLWRSNPILANIDGLNDYDEDFTDAATVFINSAGDVISGTRDQFWDDDQISEGRDKIGNDDAEEVTEETAESETDDTQSAEETEVVEADTAEVEDMDDSDVEDMDDFGEFGDADFTRNDRLPEPELRESTDSDASPEKVKALSEEPELEEDEEALEEQAENDGDKTAS